MATVTLRVSKSRSRRGSRRSVRKLEEQRNPRLRLTFQTCCCHEVRLIARKRLWDRTHWETFGKRDIGGCPHKCVTRRAHVCESQHPGGGHPYGCQVSTRHNCGVSKVVYLVVPRGSTRVVQAREGCPLLCWLRKVL